MKFTNPFTARAGRLVTASTRRSAPKQSSALDPSLPLTGGATALAVQAGAAYDPGNLAAPAIPTGQAPPAMTFPGVPAAAARTLPPAPPATPRDEAPFRPDGYGTGRGVLSGTTESASLAPGAAEWSGYSWADMRGIPTAFPDRTDPGEADKVIAQRQPYRIGRYNTAVMQGAPAASFDSEVAEFFYGNHGVIPGTIIRPWPREVYAQQPQGGAYPAVYRPQPQPWDAGTVRCPPNTPKVGNSST